MIASIQGKIIQKEPHALIIQTGGFGVRVFVPQWLAESATAGEHIRLETHFIVREQEMALYGFESEGERDLFALLLGVNGVGPRVALALLSTLSREQLQNAVFHEQPEILAHTPGIGKKTAQKIIFHLKDRLQPLDALESAAQMDTADTETLAALTALGYSVVEAQTALQSLPPDAPQNVEERLRLALQYFSQP